MITNAIELLTSILKESEEILADKVTGLANSDAKMSFHVSSADALRLALSVLSDLLPKDEPKVNNDTESDGA